MAKINNNEHPASLLILGVYLNSEGYPNVKYRLESIKNSRQLSVTEINCPMWDSDDLGRPQKYKIAYGLLRGFVAHLTVFIRYLLSQSKSQVYIPYPAVFVSLFLSLLPCRFRPNRIFIDAFISLYDTAVIDRKILKKGGFIAKALKVIERRAFKYATLVITDTELNNYYYSNLFQLQLDKFVSIPLATNEKHFLPLPHKPNKKICRILFVGTLVPLHGIETILSAIEQLKDNHNIKFTIIGNGQDGTKVEKFIEHDRTNITWIKEWLDSEQLAQQIHQSDICLGIFGNSAKAQRVCPLKFYLYASCAKPIITAESDWSKFTLKNMAAKPFEITPAGDSLALANKIKYLSKDKEKLNSLSNSSRFFYDEFLSNSQSSLTLIKLLL